MRIQYKVSKIWKVIDSMNGKAVEDAKIELSPGNPVVLKKGGGFYIGMNLGCGTYRGKIYHQKYESKEFLCTISPSDSCPVFVLFLVPEKRRREAEGIQWSGMIKRKKRICANCSFYFGMMQKRKDRRILAETAKGESFLKMEYGNTDTLDYRRILIEGQDVVYSVLNYSFEKKGFFLSSALKQDVLSGSFVSGLQEGQTDDEGRFAFYFEHQFFTGQDRIEILLFVNGKKYSFLPDEKYIEVEEQEEKDGDCSL